MARYELIEGSSKKFWEITLDGKSFTTRWGRLGTDGQTLTKKLASPAAAEKEHDRLVAEKVKKGYALVGGKAGAKGGAKAPDPDRAAALPDSLRYENPKTQRFWEIARKGDKGLLFRQGAIGKAGTRSEKSYPEAWKATSAYDDLQNKKRADGFERRDPPIDIAPSKENRELLAAILAAPDDPQGFLVYGDWLQAEGDPRGELIALQSANKRAAAEKWIVKHAPSLLGPLQPYTRRSIATPRGRRSPRTPSPGSSASSIARGSPSTTSPTRRAASCGSSASST